jgi:aminoglycoside 3-N-acetyltransferase
MLTGLRRKVQRTLHHVRNPISPEETRRALDAAVGDGADLLFVHSSLSSLGRFTAGPSDILAALREVAGTLGLPTHSYTYPEILGEAAPVFDPASTPSQNGMLTELFRGQAGVIRSTHSTHSLAMTGPLAAELTASHHLNDTPCGAGTPYARMIERKASALMWGVSFHSYTFYHTAEDAAGSAFAYEPETRDRLRVVDDRGRVQERISRRQTRDPRRFAECGELMEKAGLVRRVQLGAGSLLFVPDCAKAHDFLVERLRKTPDFLYQTCATPLA